MGKSTTSSTARPGRRQGLRSGAVLAVVTVASLLTGGLAATASASPAAGPSPSVAATKPAAKKPATKKPAVPKTLGALNATMDKAIQAKGSVAFSYAMTSSGVTGVSSAGVVSWRKGFASFDVKEKTLGVGMHWISLPGVTYMKLEDGSIPGADPASWEVYRQGGKDASAFLDDQIALKRQHMNPGRLYPGRALAALKLTTGKPATVGGVKCAVYTVRMTATQKFGAQPATTRDTPAEMRGGTATTTFYVDASGLPRKVVVTSTMKAGKYTETSTFSRWGAPVTVRAPQL